MTSPLTVLLTVRDEEEQLPGALASVAGWAGEVVVVVDPRATDRTRELSSEAGARVLEHPFESSAAQCNWGLDRCESRWVLVLDADERVTARLRDEIGQTLAAPACAAYAVRRVNLAFGRRVRFGDWGRDEVVRLVDRTQARFVAASTLTTPASPDASMMTPSLATSGAWLCPAPAIRTLRRARTASRTMAAASASLRMKYSADSFDRCRPDQLFHDAIYTPQQYRQKRSSMYLNG